MTIRTARLDPGVYDSTVLLLKSTKRQHLRQRTPVFFQRQIYSSRAACCDLNTFDQQTEHLKIVPKHSHKHVRRLVSHVAMWPQQTLLRGTCPQETLSRASKLFRSKQQNKTRLHVWENGRKSSVSVQIKSAEVFEHLICCTNQASLRTNQPSGWKRYSWLSHSSFRWSNANNSFHQSLDAEGVTLLGRATCIRIACKETQNPRPERRRFTSKRAGTQGTKFLFQSRWERSKPDPLTTRPTCWSISGQTAAR